MKKSKKNIFNIFKTALLINKAVFFIYSTLKRTYLVLHKSIVYKIYIIEVFFIKGIYNKGLIKTTNGQKKKHRTQMTPSELEYISNILKNINFKKIHLTHHALNNNVSASIQQIHNILSKDNITDLIIEYNETPTKYGLEHRVLIRDNDDILVTYNPDTNKEFKEISNLCFVICLDNFKIITTYYNICNDKHTTLNLNRYSNELKIINKIQPPTSKHK